MLDPHKCWLDVLACEHLLDKIETLLTGNSESTKSSGKHHEIKGLESRIINMYKGDFFTQDAIPSWAIRFRERLHDRFIRFIELLGMYYEHIGDTQQAIFTYKKGLEVENHAELFYQRLMIIYKSLERYAEVAAAYKRCASTLSDMLDIEPSDKTKELYRSIKP